MFMTKRMPTYLRTDIAAVVTRAEKDPEHKMRPLECKPVSPVARAATFCRNPLVWIYDTAYTIYVYTHVMQWSLCTHGKMYTRGG